MTYYGSRKDVFSMKNGWMGFDDLVEGLARSVQSAQDKLAGTGDASTHLRIKDIRIDMPIEVHHEAGTSDTRVRLPSFALQLNRDVNEKLLSRVQFTLSHVLKQPEQ
ncbi:hypothetical protein ACE3NQ_29570 [Paenibacillus terreus]|uniref:Uncharacterized protein n=1 Tax=Paenibacillus terreus TaxID=1387834 RepID=A0ABV5BH90_9BACL